MRPLEIREERYDSPAATALITEVQAEYVVRYGSPDEAVVDPDEFAAPQGHFVVGYAGGTPVAMGGWRRLDEERAELKRMFVVAAERGKGHARAVLAHLEDSARAAGIRELILITGVKQPEAIALYASCGYAAVTPFGHYAGYPDARFLGKVL